EAVLVAAGHRSPALVRRAGLALPIRPAKGYSVTLHMENMDSVPRVPLIDETMHAAITPLGNRLRMTSTVEFAGFDKRVDPQRIRELFSLLEELYPRLASRVDRGNANPWAGLRPVSSDGLPFVGAGKLPGLYINAGHGPLGWTLAMGSAHLLADCIEGQASEIDATPFDASRQARLTD
ncbi:MAG: FAD-dependent oxidoreductase, partial [Woeseia sp.]